MRVETYSDKYLTDVISLIENFHAEAVSEYDGVIDKAAIIETIKTAEHNTAFLLIINDVAQGILYGTMLRSPMNGGQIFQEFIWYVNKEFRGKGVWLLEEVQKYLKSSGVSIMIMAVLENSKTDKIKKFYERLGFKKMETHYVRSLNGLG